MAETIIALGPEGETELIAMIRKNEAKSKVLNNSKAKDCIIKAFALSNI